MKEEVVWTSDEGFWRWRGEEVTWISGRGDSLRAEDNLRVVEGDSLSG